MYVKNKTWIDKDYKSDEIVSDFSLFPKFLQLAYLPKFYLVITYNNFMRPSLWCDWVFMYHIDSATPYSNGSQFGNRARGKSSYFLYFKNSTRNCILPRNKAAKSNVMLNMFTFNLNLYQTTIYGFYSLRWKNKIVIFKSQLLF